MKIEIINKLLEANTATSQITLEQLLQSLEKETTPLDNTTGLITLLTHQNATPHLIAMVIHISGILQKQNRLLSDQFITLKNHIRLFLSDYILNMNADDISMTLSGIAQLQFHSSPALASTLNNNLTKVLLLTVEKMSAKQLSENMWALTYLGFLHAENFIPPLKDSLLGAITANVGEMNTPELVNCLWALSMLNLTWNHINRFLKTNLLTSINHNASKMSPIEIADTLFALTRLKALFNPSQQALILDLFHRFFHLFWLLNYPLEGTEPLLWAYPYLKSQMDTTLNMTAIELQIQAYEEIFRSSKHLDLLTKNSFFSTSSTMSSTLLLGAISSPELSRS